MVTDIMHAISSHTKSPEETKARVYEILADVLDPEVPVLSVLDLGIIRGVEISGDETNPLVEVLVTPTYSGCPAIDVINMNIRMALLQQGFSNTKLTQVLSPAWTSDWISEAGRDKLRAYGIAPPRYRSATESPEAFQEEEAVQCPQCRSFNTRLVSQFGSTACKAFYQCNDCHEPFDHFKCH